MQIISILTTALLAVSAPVIAAPAPLEAVAAALEDRASAAVQCDKHTFKNRGIQNAAKQGYQEWQNRPAHGKLPGGFPKAFKNTEGFDFSSEGPYFMFPILRDGRVWNSTHKPGPDRVIVSYSPQMAVAGVITKAKNGTDHAFVQCELKQ